MRILSLFVALFCTSAVCFAAPAGGTASGRCPCALLIWLRPPRQRPQFAVAQPARARPLYICVNKPVIPETTPVAPATVLVVKQPAATSARGSCCPSN